MSFSRFALVAVIAGLSAFAINANAAASDPASDPSAPAAAQAQPAAGDASAIAPQAAKDTKADRTRMAKININSADKAALAKIKAIGAKKAAIIIAYREKNGPFSSIDDLKNITNKKGKAIFSDRAIKSLNHRLTSADASSTAPTMAADANSTQQK